MDSIRKRRYHLVALVSVGAIMKVLVLEGPAAWAAPGDGRAGSIQSRSTSSDRSEPTINGKYVVLRTSDSRFDAAVDNQGWWSPSARNHDSNDNYFVGGHVDDFRNFFTFDVSSLSGTVVSATLMLKRYRGRGEATEVYVVHDVSTPARRLNRNRGTSWAIWNDLGTGDAYGFFSITTEGDENEVLQLALNAEAVADINAASHWFSVGGRLQTASFNDGLFGFSDGLGVQALIVEVE